MVTLREELQTFTRKLIWRLRLRAVLQTVSIIIATAFVLGWVDFQLRPELSLIRYLLSIFFWAVLLATVLLRLLPAWFKKINPVDVAFAIEEGSGRESGELAAVVDLTRSCPSEDEQSEWQQVVTQRVFETTPQSSPQVRSTALVVYGILLATILSASFVFASSTTVIAVTRIGWPRSEQTWPQLTKLAIFDKKQNPVSPGSIVSLVGTASTEFEVIDELGTPPEEMTLEIRRPSQPIKRIRLRRSHRAKIVHGLPPFDVFDFRLIPNPKESMQFRVVGGDDRSMAWITLRRETKPVIQGISCLMTPPEYLASEPSQLENWAGLMTAPIGANLTFDVVMNRPIVEFKLRSANGETSLQNSLRGLKFDFEIEVTPSNEKELTYDLFVRTERPVEKERSLAPIWQRVKRIRIDPITDSPPEVVLILPHQDFTVTKNAVVPLHATASDDYGFATFSIQIVSGEMFSLESKDADGLLESSITGNLTINRASLSEEGIIEVFAQAIDHSPNAEAVVSPIVRLSVVSEQSKELELHDKLKQVASAILSAYDNQRIVNQETQQLLNSMRTNDRQVHETEVISLLQMKQLAVRDGLVNHVEKELVTFLIEHWAMNRLTDPILKEAITTVDSELTRLIDHELENSVASLDLLRKNWKETSNTSTSENRKTELIRGIHPVMEKQELASKGLAELIQKLDRWVDAANVQSQWRFINSGLKLQMQELASFAQETVSKPFNELTDAQKTQLQKSSEAHLVLSRKLQKLTSSLSQVESQSWYHLGTSLREFQSVSRLRESAAAIQNNNVLKAVETDRNLQRKFDEFEDQRSNYRADDTSKFLTQLQENAEELQEIAKEQKELSAKWSDSPLNKVIWEEQRVLQKTMSKLAQNFEQYGMNPVASLLVEATTVVEDIIRELEDQKETNLDANLELIEQKINTATSLVSDSLQRLQNRDQNFMIRELALLSQRLLEQHEVQQQTLSIIEQIYSERGRVTRSQRRELLELSQAQRSFTEKLRPFQDGSKTLPVISQRLDLLITAMEEASAKLRQAEIGTDLTEQMAMIRSLLAQLSNLDSNGSNDDAGDAAIPLPQHVRSQIQILLERQRELVEQEESLLKDDQVIPEELKQSISDEQQDILDALKKLLEGIGQDKKTQSQ